MSGDAALDPRALSRLKWRCRRGLLENDLLIERFFLRYEATLTKDQGQGLGELMNLADNDLLDVLLGRQQLGTEASEEMKNVLEMLRPGAATSKASATDTQ